MVSTAEDDEAQLESFALDDCESVEELMKLLREMVQQYGYLVQQPPKRYLVLSSLVITRDDSRVDNPNLFSK